MGYVETFFVADAPPPLRGAFFNKSEGGIKAVYPVPTIADMKNVAVAGLTHNDHRFVLGYSAVNDGGGGLFRWNASSTATDNGGTILSPTSAPASGRWERLQQKIMNIEVFGVGTSQTAATNRTRLTAAHLAHKDSVFYFSRGDYPLDNATQLTLFDRSGGFFFTGGSRLLYSTNTTRGLTFQNCLKGFFIDGLSTVYATTPTAHTVSAGGALSVHSCDTPVLRNIKIYGSPDVGFYVTASTNIRVENISVENTWSDGAQINACSGFIRGYHSYETGDDGFALANTTDNTDVGGIEASQITVERSDVNGIAITGQHDVVISDFIVDQTNAAGISIIYNSSFNLRTPYNIRIHSGRVSNLGTYQRPSGFGYFNEGYGIRLNVTPSGTPPAEDIHIEDIEIYNSRLQSVEAATNTGKLYFRNIRYKAGPDTAGNNGGVFAVRAPDLDMSDCQVENATGAGFLIYNTPVARLRNCLAYNCSKTDTARRAFGFMSFTGGANTNVRAEGLMVADDQGTPTGYQVATFSDTGLNVDGDLGEIKYRFATALTGSQPPWIVGSTGTITARRIYSQGSQSSFQSGIPTAGYWIAGDIVRNSTPAAGSPIGWVSTTSGAQGSWQPYGLAGQNIASLGSDVTNATTSYADITGLSFPVTSGVVYRFRALVIFTANAPTTGSAWSVNGPASPTQLAYNVTYPSITTTYPQPPTITGFKAYDAMSATTATPETTGNIVEIRGIIQPSASGTFALRFASEVAVASGIVAKTGSTLEWW